MDKAFTPTLPMLFQQPGFRPPPLQQAAETVSILMRTKNRPLMLPRALASVLAQSFADWHLCLVNDGGDAAVVERIVADHADPLAGRITLIHHPESLGMEAASNRALEAAQGEYVVVHDDDDTWNPAFLERTVGFLSQPANAGYIGVVTNGCVVRERIAGDRVEETERQKFRPFGANIELGRMLARNSFPPISLLLRRSAVLQVGAFNADMPVLGDWEFNLRALALGDYAFIDETLAYYHQRCDADPVYGNSVIAGTADHQRYDILLRNNVIRLALRDNPAMFGLLQPIMHAIHEQTEAIAGIHQCLNEMRERLDRIEEHLSEVRVVASWQQRMLSPLRHVWVGITPLRRTLARLFARGA
jgi:glycosyltransferase involved in cell wall biosynthesis